jgi:uncharacterized protein (DUF2062 family)
MIFKRRERLPFWNRVRGFFAPKKGWRRGFEYIGRRVQRLPDTPHNIALGFACGAFASFTPLFTLHIALAVGLAWLFRSNLIAGAFGTVVGNPITFPFIAASSLRIGNWMLGKEDGVEDVGHLTLAYVKEHFLDFFLSIFMPYLVGGAGPGILCAIGCYYLLRPIVATYQKRRRLRIQKRAEKAAHEHFERAHHKRGATPQLEQVKGQLAERRRDKDESGAEEPGERRA